MKIHFESECRKMENPINGRNNKLWQDIFTQNVLQGKRQRGIINKYGGIDNKGI